MNTKLDQEITCQLCGMICKMQIPATHLKKAHSITTKQYKALGYETLSPARLEQLRKTPIGTGEVTGNRGKYGEEHHNWKGGHIARNGYKIISKRGKSQLYEHRVVAEEMIGRPLERDEVVHHIDGNRSNNAPENLQVMKRHEHDKLKDGPRQYFHTSPECEEAALILISVHGWSLNKTALAMRTDARTIKKWLKHQTPT